MSETIPPNFSERNRWQIAGTLFVLAAICFLLGVRAMYWTNREGLLLTVQSSVVELGPISEGDTATAVFRLTNSASHPIILMGSEEL